MQANRMVAFLIPFLLLSMSPATPAADRLVLKDGRELQGTLVRADSSVLEFRVEGAVRTFPVSEVDRIIFGGSEAAPPDTRGSTGSIRKEPAPDATIQQPALEPPAPVVFEKGTVLTVRTLEEIDRQGLRPGMLFPLILDTPLVHEGKVVVPSGTPASGKIIEPMTEGPAAGPLLALELIDLTWEGRTLPVDAAEEPGISYHERPAAPSLLEGTAALRAVIEAARGVKNTPPGRIEGNTIPARSILKFRLRSPLTIGKP